MSITYLQEAIRSVMDYYYKCANTDVVGTIRETDEEDGDGMVDNLLMKVLYR